MSHFKGVQWVNNNLSDNSKVLYCGTAAWYYMDIDYLPLASRYIDYNSFNSSGELKNTLNELGITHILIDGDLLHLLSIQRFRRYPYIYLYVFVVFVVLVFPFLHQLVFFLAFFSVFRS